MGFFIPGATSMYPQLPDTKCTKTKAVVVFTLSLTHFKRSPL